MEIAEMPSLQLEHKISALVKRQKNRVERAIGKHATKAHWDLLPNERGAPRIVLRAYQDAEAQGSMDFSQQELENDAYAEQQITSFAQVVERIDNWRSELAKLYADISTWSQKLEGVISIAEDAIVILEAKTGEYQVSRLTLKRRDQTMEVRPVSVWVVGADGRVDLKGIGGPFTLLFSKRFGGWHYLRETFPIKTEPLTEAIFLTLAEACLNG